MRLITHNMMQCLQCESFPLTIIAREVTLELAQTPDPLFVRRMLGRVDYPALVAAFASMKAAESEEENGPFTAAGLRDAALPPTVEDIDFDNTNVVNLLHLALSGALLKNGALVCPQCGASYEVREFIPNFIVTE